MNIYNSENWFKEHWRFLTDIDRLKAFYRDKK